MGFKRTFLRVPFKHPIKMATFDEPDAWELTLTRDISTTGICFESKKMIPPNAQVQLELSLKNILFPVKLNALVRWQKKIGRGKRELYLLGAEFKDPSDSAVNTITHLILEKLDIFHIRLTLLISAAILVFFSIFKVMAAGIIKHFSVTPFGNLNIYGVFDAHPLLYPYCAATLFLSLILLISCIGMFYKKPLAIDFAEACGLCWIIMTIFKIYLVKTSIGYDYIFIIANVLMILILNSPSVRIGFMPLQKDYLI